jgi:hypothetical protein
MVILRFKGVVFMGKEGLMEPSIPVPTDNLYKFIALFGLVLFVSSGITFVYSYFYFNKLLYQQRLELEIFKAKNRSRARRKDNKRFFGPSNNHKYAK